jgi:hypothetical protein
VFSTPSLFLRRGEWPVGRADIVCQFGEPHRVQVGARVAERRRLQIVQSPAVRAHNAFRTDSLMRSRSTVVSR